MIGEVFEPFVHSIGCDGGGDEDREPYQADEVAGEEGDDIGNGGAEDLADADLFYALLRGKGGEGQEAEAGDEDGNGGEEGNEGGDLLVGLVQAVELVVEEDVVEGFGGGIALYDVAGDGEGLSCFAGFGTDEENAARSIIVEDDEGLDLVVEAGEMKVFYDTDDDAGILMEADGMTEDGLGDVQGPGRRLVDNEILFILRAAGIEPMALRHLQLHYAFIILVGGELVDGGAEGRVAAIPVQIAGAGAADIDDGSIG